MNQPKFASSADTHSIDNDELFETEENLPTERPLLAAALRARAQQEQGVTALVHSNGLANLNGHEYDTVPGHLMEIHQPAYSYDEYSMDEDDLFDIQPVEPPAQKPLLQAALKARGQHTTERLVKSYSHIETRVVDMSVVHQEISQNSRDDCVSEHAVDTKEESQYEYEYEEYEVSMKESGSQNTGIAQAFSSASEYTEETIEE